LAEIQRVPTQYVTVAENFGWSSWQRWLFVIFPAVLPGVFTLQPVRRRLADPSEDRWGQAWQHRLHGGLRRDGGEGNLLGAFRSYFTAGRGVEALGSVWTFLDLTPLGRQETWEHSPPGWPQTRPYLWWRRHDEYGK
jgi:hypothetical protein